MSVRVAIPILYANLKLHLEKGRQWNVVEHLLLHRVAQEGCTAATLAEESSLPWRLVVEVMIRLMRVGWVELQTRGDETRFQITAAGSAVVGLDSLPKLTRPVSRRGSFAIDQVSGAVYRGRDFPSLYTWERLQKLKESAEVLMLPRADRLPVVQPAKVVETLLDEDEECKAIDPSGARPVDRYAVVTVVGQTIDGLPPRSGARLRTAILAAASAGIAGVEPPTPRMPAARPSPVIRMGATVQARQRLPCARGDRQDPTHCGPRHMCQADIPRQTTIRE